MLKINYHNVTTDDMLNGTGLRVVLWVSGCENHCKCCQNPQTWNVDSGILFTQDIFEELCHELSKDYISGITFSGGDPLHPNNVHSVLNLCKTIKEKFPTKTIWLYTGYTFEQIYYVPGYFMTQDVDPIRDWRNDVLQYVDVLVDGKFMEELSDINYPWAGSTNQRVIDVQKTLANSEIVLYE